MLAAVDYIDTGEENSYLNRERERKGRERRERRGGRGRERGREKREEQKRLGIIIPVFFFRCTSKRNKSTDFSLIEAMANSGRW